MAVSGGIQKFSQLLSRHFVIGATPITIVLVNHCNKNCENYCVISISVNIGQGEVNDAIKENALTLNRKRKFYIAKD